jgi:hypothetical protein
LESDGTEWIDEKGIERKLHKGGFVDIQTIVTDKYETLLPEYYFRPYEPRYVTLSDLENEVETLEAMVRTLGKSR